MRSIFQGTYHVLSHPLEALFCTQGHHNTWMEECLLLLYLAHGRLQARPHLSQVVVVPFHLITWNSQFSCKRVLEACKSPQTVSLSMAHPIMSQVLTSLEGCNQGLTSSQNWHPVKIMFWESNLEGLLMVSCMMDSQSWLIVCLGSFWGIMLTHH